MTSEESIYCPKCNNAVHDDQNSIYCDSCCSWIHLKCSGLTKKLFHEISNTDDPYFCAICLHDIFPFHSLCNTKLIKELNPVSAKSVTKFKEILNRYDKICSVCSKVVRLVQSSVPCGNCRHLTHKKCSKSPNWHIAHMHSHLTTWECPSCCVKPLSSLPFFEIENNSLLNLTFNSNYSCKCNSSAISLSDYDHLEKLETCKLTLKDHETLYSNDIDSNMNSFTEFDFYDNHEFHKLTNSYSINKEKKL